MNKTDFFSRSRDPFHPPRGGSLRQPQIEDLGLAARGHEDVRWLDVAMDGAGGVRRLQHVGNFECS